MKVTRNVTFKKLICLFVLIMIPIFCIAVYGLIYTYNQYKESMYASLRQSSDRAVQQVDQDLKQLYNLAIGVVSQSNVRKAADRYLYISNYELANTINVIREQQTSLCEANEYLNNLIVYYQNLGKAYNADVEDMGSFFEFSQEDWEAKIHSATRLGSYTYQDGCFTNLIMADIAASYLIELKLDTAVIWSNLCAPFATYDFACALEMADGTVLVNPDNTVHLPSELLGDGAASDTEKTGNDQYTHIVRRLNNLDSDVYFFFPNTVLFRPLSVMIKILIAFFICAIITIAAFIFGSMRLVRKPMNKLVRGFDQIMHKNYSTQIDFSSASDFQQLYSSFNEMAQQLDELIERNYKYQLAMNKAELRQLQSQITPHFLYNSFFMMRSLISDKLNNDALRLCSALGIYYRYITQNSGDSAPLAKEYEHAKTYADIQSMRFGDRVDVKVQPLPDAFHALPIPKLIIQPLLENAFQYSFNTMVTGGILKLSFVVEANGLWIAVEDNGETITDLEIAALNVRLVKKEEEEDMSALLNIQKRLQLFSGGNNRLVLSRSALGGLKAAIWIETENYVCIKS